MPPTIPINHYFGPRTNKIEPKSYHVIPCFSIQANACFKHSNFFKVTILDPTTTKLMTAALSRRMTEPNHIHTNGRRAGPIRNPTTSFLTATTLIYAIGAGITAAAGTRLALQLILDKGFKLFSFQLQDSKALHCYFLSLPPCVRIG